MKKDLRYFFNPRNIAVVGASKAEGKMGNLVLKHLLAGFSGKIFPVHPTEREIEGLSTYPDLPAIPEQLDLVIPLIPGEQLLTLVRRCVRGHVKFLLAIPSGFGEVGPREKAFERELVQLAKERDTRVVGPNTAGMLNCCSGLNASILPGSMVPALPPGGVGFSCVTQSGGFGMIVYLYSVDHQLKIAKFCDVGNSADIQVHEVLHYLRYDIDTKIVGLFLESVPEYEAFVAQACAFAAKKPLILTKIGRTKPGGRASFAHLGIPADSEHIQDLMSKGQVIPAETGLEMLHIAKGLNWQPLPRGRRVGILTGSGGIGTELADLCAELGLEVPEFSIKLQKALRPLLPSYASVNNPVDVTPLWKELPKIYPPLLQALFASQEFDILIVTVMDMATTMEDLLYSLSDSVEEYNHVDPKGKPLYVYWASTHSELKNMQILEKSRLPCYRSTKETVLVAAAIARYAVRHK